MTPYTAFLPEVMPFVHDCPEISALAAVRNAAIEFCEKSHYWQVDLQTSDTDKGENKYPVIVPKETVMISIIDGWYKNRRLQPKTADQLAFLFRGIDWRTVTGDPMYITKMTGPQVQLCPTPQSTEFDSISMRAVLAPTRNSTGVDDDIYERFLEVIAKGARSRLYATPGQPYYDMNLAMSYRKEFITGIGEAKIMANKGLSRTSGSIQMRPF
jgi:hypothetical protein